MKFSLKMRHWGKLKDILLRTRMTFGEFLTFVKLNKQMIIDDKRYDQNDNPEVFRIRIKNSIGSVSIIFYERTNNNDPIFLSGSLFVQSPNNLGIEMRNNVSLSEIVDNIFVPD